METDPAPRRLINKPPVSFYVTGADQFWDWYESPAWEPDTVVAFTRLLTPETRYVDLGGYMGPTALFAANIVSRVHVVEPNPVTREALLRNIELNPELAKKITVHGFAVSARDGTLSLGSLHGGADSESSLCRKTQPKESWTVRSVSVSKFLAMDGIGDGDFFKIDTEGAEYEIIPAMAQFIKSRRPTIYLATHGSYLLDKSSFAAKVRSGLRVLALNWKLIKALMPYRYHYQFDPKSGRYRDVKFRNLLRLLFPLPILASFSNGGVFTDRQMLD